MLDFLRADHHMLILILSVGTVFTYIWLMLFRERLRFNWWKALIASLVHTVFGVLCVTTFAMLETLNLKAFGNLSIFGATFFMPILFFAFAKLGKRNMADVFDIGCISMMFTLMCSRFNCLVCGCCYGIPFFGSATLQWPTREMEILFYIIMIILLGRRVKQNRSYGYNYPIYMIAYGVFRFVTEWVRHYSGSAVIHRAHVWAIISLCLGISILAEIKNKQNKVRR